MTTADLLPLALLGAFGLGVLSGFVLAVIERAGRRDEAEPEKLDPEQVARIARGQGAI